jgi:osmoprotectant transport system ATP-binding protein
MSRITFDAVSKIYPGNPRPAIADCSLTVDDGALVVVLGPSGCGKTTLLKMVNRLVEPTGGRIFLDDVDVMALAATDLRRRTGYVIQHVGLFPHLTVRRNVAVVPELLRWPRARIEARVDELLRLVGLSPATFGARYPAQLSGGQQQRVGVARALAGDPGVILMDEPFGAIDAITRARLQDELLRLHRSLGKTILFVTHDVEEALHLADRIVVMREGHIVQVGRPIELLRSPADAFVAELLGADDLVRALGLLPVAAIMRPATAPARSPAPHEAPAAAAADPPVIDPSASVRRALSLLLGTAAAELVVADGGHPVGLVSLADIRAAAQAPP